MSWWVSQWGSSSVYVVVTDPWIMVRPVALTYRTGELERLSGARSQLEALGLLNGAAATAVTARAGTSGLCLGVASDARHLLSSVTYHITSSWHATTGSVCHPNHSLTPDPQVMVSGGRALRVMKSWGWSPICDQCSHEGDPRESPSSPRWGQHLWSRKWPQQTWDLQVPWPWVPASRAQRTQGLWLMSPLL